LHIDKLKLPLNIQEYFSINNLNKIVSFMIKDKKNNTNKINLILLKKIGSTVINNYYNTKKIKNFLRQELVN
jgi:3-dehydroquinate synthase/shikimate kinase/3-dehydroquinate synthase